MKIIKEDQNLMILRDLNITIFIVGIVFMIVGFMTIFKPDFFTNQPPLWAGFVGVLIGMFVVFVGKIIIINIDKTSNKLLFLKKGLISKSIKEYSLDQIKEIELSVNYSSSNKNGGYLYSLAFILNNDQSIQLNPNSSSITKIMGRQIIPEKNIGERIANFLAIPFKENRPPTVDETLATVSSAIQNAIEKEKEKN